VCDLEQALAPDDLVRLARAALAYALRDGGDRIWRYSAQLAATSSQDFSKTPDTELLDAINYLLFPNFNPWGGAKSNIIYRFRPNGLDPDSCTAEIIFMSSPKRPGEMPPPHDVWMTVLE